MFIRMGTITTLVFTLGLLLSGCAKDDMTGLRPNLANGASAIGQATQIASNSTVVQCSVSTAAARVAAGQAFSISILAAGGTAPYTLANYGTFSGAITISGSFNNTTGADEAVQRNFTISDAAGNLGYCFFQLIVGPPAGSSSTANSNTCTITASTANPVINQSITFSISTNYTGSYTVNQIYYQSDWSDTFNSSQTGTSTIDVTYTTAGTRTFSALLNINGQPVTCTLPVTVAAQ